MLDINKLIMQAMKEKNQIELEVLRGIKNEFTKYITQKQGNVVDDIVEGSILTKMKKQRLDSIESFKSANRLDLVDKEMLEYDIICKYAPKEVTEDELREIITIFVNNKRADGIAVSMKDMGELNKSIKSSFPSADGKIIANIFKNLL